MIKPIMYAGSCVMSCDIEGVPHACMEHILETLIEGSWGDYTQVLNSSADMVYDLDVKCVDETWLIPVTGVSTWLYSFSLRNMKGVTYDRFRVFRRDIEKVLRVAWALPVDNLVAKKYEAEYHEGSFTMWDMANIFLSYGLKDEELEGSIGEGEAFGALHYLEYVAASTSCGSRGSLLCEQIQYIEDMPNGGDIFNHLNEVLITNLMPPTDYLDDYLDDLNTFISLEATRFVGEL